jgi:hypothetical protein
MNTLPDPLIPLDCDLTDFQFMPLDVARLRDSELATLESPEACWAAVLLWCVSWHQIPAASLPNDDRMLAKYAGYLSRGKIDPAWNKIRDGAMRNWILCSDNRYYHPVVAEKALTAWKSKWEQAYRTELARIKKHNQRHTDDQLEIPSLDDFMSTRTSPDCPADKSQLSQGQTPIVPRKSHPTDTETETEGILKGYIKPISSVITEGQTNGDEKPQSEHLKTQPTEPAHWVDHFNQQYGTDYGYKTTAQRKHIWPVLTRWCKDGYTVEQVSTAVKRAHEEAIEPIVNLILYVDRVLASIQTKKAAPLQWWTTEKGRADKLKELGMSTRPGENNNALVARIQAEIDRRATQ